MTATGSVGTVTNWATVDDLGDLEDLYSFTQPSIDNVGGPLFEAIASRTGGTGDHMRVPLVASSTPVRMATV